MFCGYAIVSPPRLLCMDIRVRRFPTSSQPHATCTQPHQEDCHLRQTSRRCSASYNTLTYAALTSEPQCIHDDHRRGGAAPCSWTRKQLHHHDHHQHHRHTIWAALCLRPLRPLGLDLKKLHVFIDVWMHRKTIFMKLNGRCPQKKRKENGFKSRMQQTCAMSHMATNL